MFALSFFTFIVSFQARNKPVDGSCHNRLQHSQAPPQRERTPSGHTKHGSVTTPTSNKPPLTSKSSSQSLNGKLSTNASIKPATRPGQKHKKKKQIYDVNVTIDLVSFLLEIRSLANGLEVESKTSILYTVYLGSQVVLNALSYLRYIIIVKIFQHSKKLAICVLSSTYFILYVNICIVVNNTTVIHTYFIRGYISQLFYYHLFGAHSNNYYYL